MTIRADIGTVFRPTEPIPPKPRPKKPKKPYEVKRSALRRSAAAQRKKEKIAARHKRNEVARQASKMALEKVAVETFGEGGLTPERVKALSAVLVGPDEGVLNITNATQLKVLVRKAREKFLKHAGSYMDIHLTSVRTALARGEVEVAARHSEWAIDRLGDGEERVTDVPQMRAATGPAPAAQTVMLGVNMGGIPKQK